MRLSDNEHLNLVDSIRDPDRKNATRCAKLPIKKSDVVSCVFRRCVNVLGGRTGFCITCELTFYKRVRCTRKYHQIPKPRK